MKPRVDLISLGVRDLDASRRFYVDGLGWPTSLDVPGEVIFLPVGHRIVLSLWSLDAMIAEVGPVGDGPASITLAHNVDTVEEITEILDRAVAAGGTLLVPATEREWGGSSGYVADPDGYRWEIAVNPGFLDRFGRSDV
jgi:catechol 2,3-dioxygenase-like lactoylglutathione lyase family enzyme